MDRRERYSNPLSYILRACEGKLKESLDLPSDCIFLACDEVIVLSQVGHKHCAAPSDLNGQSGGYDEQ